MVADKLVGVDRGDPRLVAMSAGSAGGRRGRRGEGNITRSKCDLGGSVDDNLMGKAAPDAEALAVDDAARRTGDDGVIETGGVEIEALNEVAGGKDMGESG